MKIIFGCSSSIPSRIIQFRTKCEWSHVGIVDGDHVIHAAGIRPLKFILVLLSIIPNALKLGGVRRTPISEFLKSYTKTQVAYIDGNINIALDMVDRVMYDAVGVLGLFFGRSIGCHEKMSCAKMLWLCADHADDEFADRATPQMILAIIPDKKMPH
tara:strand:+ start:201 stop:671 length:471 start_codon:yes stop_codon:yes gene_type:complete